MNNHSKGLFLCKKNMYAMFSNNLSGDSKYLCLICVYTCNKTNNSCRKKTDDSKNVCYEPPPLKKPTRTLKTYIDKNINTNTKDASALRF